VADRPTNSGREDTVVRPLAGTAGAPSRNGSVSAKPAPATPPRGAAAAATRDSAPPTVATPVVTAPPAQEKPTRAERKAQRAAAAAAAAPKAGRRARLRLTRVDPWSVMKTAFLLSIALAIVSVVSVLMVWTVLGAADVWSSINQTVQDVVGGQDANSFDIEDYLGTRRVVGFTMIVAAVDVLLLTAIATLGAFLYNMSASLLGGVEVTLAEDN